MKVEVQRHDVTIHLKNNNFVVLKKTLGIQSPSQNCSGT